MFVLPVESAEAISRGVWHPLTGSADVNLKHRNMTVADNKCGKQTGSE